jgi:preprotein translocase subunit Sec63
MDDHQSLSRQIRAAFGPDVSLYEILGVPRDASPEAIRRAYRLRALKLHPDKGGTIQQPTINNGRAVSYLS